jgi:hypothetical protein
MLRIFLGLILLFSTVRIIVGKNDYPKKRPLDIKTFCDTGILTDWGGNKWAIASIELKNGKKRNFLRVAPDLIDGKHYFCDVPPSITNPQRDTILCQEWPSNIILGKTKVQVIYWWATVHGKKQRITDQIFTLP